MSDSKIPAMPQDGYDLFSDRYVNDAPAVWAEIRNSGCPVAHSDMWGGSWLPTAYDDIHRLAHDPEHLSSRAVEFSGVIPEPGAGLYFPPLTSDPPEHKLHRDLLEPFFTPARIAAIEPYARAKAHELAQAVAARGEGDVAADFSKPMALFILTKMIDVPEERQAKFMDWAIRILKIGPSDQEVRAAAYAEAFADLSQLLLERAAAPGDDMISHLALARINGEPISRKHQIGSLLLAILAGADTTWNALNASIYHFAEFPADRATILARPELLRTTAVEELLRVYAPLSIGRITTAPVEVQGRCIAAQQRVILAYAAANRDPAVFEKPDEVQLERKRNRHLTFGTGNHRCMGAHLARMEVRVGIEEWLRAIPHFERISGEVKWGPGQVRGPENVRIRTLAGDTTMAATETPRAG